MGKKALREISTFLTYEDISLILTIIYSVTATWFLHISFETSVILPGRDPRQYSVVSSGNSILGKRKYPEAVKKIKLLSYHWRAWMKNGTTSEISESPHPVTWATRRRRWLVSAHPMRRHAWERHPFSSLWDSSSPVSGGLVFRGWLTF